MRAHFQPRYAQQDGTGLKKDSDWYHVSGTVVMVGGIQYILRIAKRFLVYYFNVKKTIHLVLPTMPIIVQLTMS
jgi:hypothetical protein